MTGTPALVSSLYLSDSNQALSFDGSTNSMSVPDSASDSLAVVVGGAAMEGFFNLPAIPGTTKTITGKTGSYVLQVNSAGKLLWTFTNGASTITVTSATTIQPNTSYHVVGVYNGSYTGAPVFGNQIQGPAPLMSMPGDYFQGSSTGANNLWVSKENILEKGQITSVVMDLKRVQDTTNNEWVAAVVYRDSAGVPGIKAGQSDPIQLSNVSVVGRQWVSFPVNAVIPAGVCWLGFVAGSESGQFAVGTETSGGQRVRRNAPVSDTSNFQLTGDAPDPFGSYTGSDTGRLSIYANYTPIARTGDEGKALLYLNGVLDASMSYAAGIGDTANALSFAPSVAVKLDDWSIWNKALTPVQVATHYAASGGVGVSVAAPPPGGLGLFGDLTFGDGIFGG
jgi:hypothetical protein